jgi:hypothetical protein
MIEFLDAPLSYFLGVPSSNLKYVDRAILREVVVIDGLGSNTLNKLDPVESYTFTMYFKTAGIPVTPFVGAVQDNATCVATAVADPERFVGLLVTTFGVTAELAVAEESPTVLCAVTLNMY